MKDLSLVEILLYWIVFGGILFISLFISFCNKSKLIYVATILVSFLLSIIYLFIGAKIFSVFQLIFACSVVFYIKNNEKILCEFKNVFKTLNARFYFIVLTFGLLFISLFYLVSVSLNLSNKTTLFVNNISDEIIDNVSTFINAIFNDYLILLIISIMIIIVVAAGVLTFKEKGSDE